MRQIVELMKAIEANFDKELKVERELTHCCWSEMSRIVEWHLETLTNEELNEIIVRSFDKAIELSRKHTREGVFWKLENQVGDVGEAYSFMFMNEAVHFRNCSYDPTSKNKDPNYNYVKDLCYVLTVGRIKIGIMHSFDKDKQAFVTNYNTWNRVTTYIDYCEDNLIQRMFNDMQ